MSRDLTIDAYQITRFDFPRDRVRPEDRLTEFIPPAPVKLVLSQFGFDG